MFTFNKGNEKHVKGEEVSTLKAVNSVDVSDCIYFYNNGDEICTRWLWKKRER
jgi:hypothetical protein